MRSLFLYKHPPTPTHTHTYTRFASLPLALRMCWNALSLLHINKPDIHARQPAVRAALFGAGFSGHSHSIGHRTGRHQHPRSPPSSTLHQNNNKRHTTTTSIHVLQFNTTNNNNTTYYHNSLSNHPPNNRPPSTQPPQPLLQLGIHTHLFGQWIHRFRLLQCFLILFSSKHQVRPAVALLFARVLFILRVCVCVLV